MTEQVMTNLPETKRALACYAFEQQVFGQIEYQEQMEWAIRTVDGFNRAKVEIKTEVEDGCACCGVTRTKLVASIPYARLKGFEPTTAQYEARLNGAPFDYEPIVDKKGKTRERTYTAEVDLERVSPVMMFARVARLADKAPMSFDNTESSVKAQAEARAVWAGIERKRKEAAAKKEARR